MFQKSAVCLNKTCQKYFQVCGYNVKDVKFYCSVFYSQLFSLICCALLLLIANKYDLKTSVR